MNNASPPPPPPPNPPKKKNQTLPRRTIQSLLYRPNYSMGAFICIINILILELVGNMYQSSFHQILQYCFKRTFLTHQNVPVMQIFLHLSQLVEYSTISNTQVHIWILNINLAMNIHNSLQVSLIRHNKGSSHLSIIPVSPYPRIYSCSKRQFSFTKNHSLHNLIHFLYPSNIKSTELSY